MQNKHKDPYSYLFPLGILSAVFAVILWIVFNIHWLSFFPRQSHANLMFFGFLWSFIAGFLMTAIPKMTQAIQASQSEVLTAMAFVLTQWLLNIFNLINYSFIVFSLQILLLIFFVIRRFLKKRQLPFEGFVFMPAAFLAAIIGLISVLFLGEEGYRLLYLFSGQAFVLNLICGLGSRLIPVLSRVPQSLNPDVKSDSSKLVEFILLALALNISFILEAFQFTSIGFALRGLILSILAIRHFKILKKPSVYSIVGWGLRLSVVMMILSFFILTVVNTNPLPIMHLFYVFGLALMTLMVATRVTVAHGGFNLDIELKSKMLIFIVVAFSISALARFFNGNNINGFWLYTAIAFFLLAVTSWFYKFILKMFISVNKK